MASTGEFKVKTSANQKQQFWEDILCTHDTKVELVARFGSGSVAF